MFLYESIVSPFYLHSSAHSFTHGYYLFPFTQFNCKRFLFLLLLLYRCYHFLCFDIHNTYYTYSDCCFCWNCISVSVAPSCSAFSISHSYGGFLVSHCIFFSHELSVSLWIAFARGPSASFILPPSSRHLSSLVRTRSLASRYSIHNRKSTFVVSWNFASFFLSFSFLLFFVREFLNVLTILCHAFEECSSRWKRDPSLEIQSMPRGVTSREIASLSHSISSENYLPEVACSVSRDLEIENSCVLVSKSKEKRKGSLYSRSLRQ